MRAYEFFLNEKIGKISDTSSILDIYRWKRVPISWLHAIRHNQLIGAHWSTDPIAQKPKNTIVDENMMIICIHSRILSTDIDAIQTIYGNQNNSNYEHHDKNEVVLKPNTKVKVIDITDISGKKLDVDISTLTVKLKKIWIRFLRIENLILLNDLIILNLKVGQLMKNKKDFSKNIFLINNTMNNPPYRKV